MSVFFAWLVRNNSLQVGRYSLFFCISWDIATAHIDVHRNLVPRASRGRESFFAQTVCSEHHSAWPEGNLVGSLLLFSA